MRGSTSISGDIPKIESIQKEGASMSEVSEVREGAEPSPHVEAELRERSRHVKAALREVGDGFRQFSRNGRWGGCSGCPVDADGRKYPEFCAFTDRYDHQLTVDQLAESFKIHERISAERRTW